MRLVAFKYTAIVFFGAMCLLGGDTEAQEGEDWQFSAAAYFWGAGLDGVVGVNSRTVEIDQSFSDILSNLEFGFMGALRADAGVWAVTGDVMYIGLGATVQGALENPIEVDVDQIIFTGDIGYAISENAEIIGGFRIVSLQNILDFSGPRGARFEADKTWVDPFVGVRFTPRLSEKWSLLTRFDIGGFDVGSDLAWQVNANAALRISERASLVFGYRILDMDYDDEDEQDRFVYDATAHGPIAGIVFGF